MIALEVIAMPLENGLLGVKMLLVIYTVSTTETMTTAHAMHTVDQVCGYCACLAHCNADCGMHKRNVLYTSSIIACFVSMK